MDYLRRQINLQGTKVALGLVSFPLISTDILTKRLLFSLTQQRSPDSETVHYLQQRVEHYWNQRQTAKLGSVLVPYIIEDLQRVCTLLEGSLLANTRAELSGVAGNMAMLLGELFYELNLYVEARKYYKIAAIAAHETNNPLLEAVVYGRRSLTWIYQNHLKAALFCVQHAGQLARGNDRIITWLAAIEAEIQATIGDQNASLSSLRSAARLHNLPQQGAFYWIHFDASLLAGYEGACFLKMGKPAEAHQALANALATLDTTTNRRRPRLLIDLAHTYVQQKEIEAACDSLLQATELLHSIRSPVTLKRLLTLRKQLHPWQEMPFVQTLDESLCQLVESRGTTTYGPIQ